MEDGRGLVFLVLWFFVSLIFSGTVGKKRVMGQGWSFVLCFILGIIGIIIVCCGEKKAEFMDVNKKNEEIEQ
jgi:hypothetical protein